jgi:hypothetical protein
MEFYFDIKFIEDFQNQVNNDEIYYEFYKFIKQLNGKLFIFNTEEEISKTILENSILLKNLTTVIPKFIPSSSYEDIISDEKTTGFKCFFVNQFDILELQNDYGYFATNSTELVKYYDLFNSGRQDLKKVTSPNIGENFLHSWTVLQQYSHPINSFIICDRYCFTRKNNLDINILSLISNIKLVPLNKRKIDILVITELIFENQGQNIDVSRKNSHLVELNNILRNHIENYLERDKYNLTIIKLDEHTTPRASDIHSRFLVTNFFSIDSHPSFSFFILRNGNVVPRVNENVDFDYLIWRRSLIPMIEKLNHIKKAFTSIPETMQLGSIKMPIEFQQRYVIAKDKHCRLLK